MNTRSTPEPGPDQRAPAWTTLGDLVGKLRGRWNRGTYLRAYAERLPFDPISLGVRAPRSSELVEHFDEMRRWVERFDVENRTDSQRQHFVVERSARRTRTLGENLVPVRVKVDSFAQLCSILGTGEEVRRLDWILELTREADDSRTSGDGLLSWVVRHPLVAIDSYSDWPGLLAVVDWIVANDPSLANLQVRHLDVAGIDTKFVERHTKILRRLLDHALPAGRVDLSKSKFEDRYGFGRRPSYVRFRLLAPLPEIPAPISEAELQVDELALLPLSVATVFIVENQATYLAFPDVPDAIVIFGKGFGVTVLEGVPWLAEREVIYWGDIDSHGFSILNRLRQRIPGARSILMDRSTFLAHRSQLVSEDAPTRERLVNLSADEQALYSDLVEDRYGVSRRLEQERIRFSLVRQALSPWLDDTRPNPRAS